MKKDNLERHCPVLLEEVLGFLEKKSGQIVVDATFGSGGHSGRMLEELAGKGFLVAMDIDRKAEKVFNEFSYENRQKAVFVQGNFRDIKRVLQNQHIKKVDFILADLGWRLEQIKDDDYGLNFFSQKSLSMRLDGGKEGLTAEEIVNNWPVKDLAKMFLLYGEEKHAFRAAQAIEKARQEERIVSSGKLAEIIQKSLGGFYRKTKLHSATRIFQALRIFVNDELKNLEIFLSEALNCLNENGKLAVITFHSGEDRIVKNFFRVNARGCICPPEFPKCVCGRKPGLQILTRKPVLPSPEELKKNPRSRSAKLRVAKKIKN